MKAFRDQSINQGVEVVGEDVNRVDLKSRPFKVWAGDVAPTPAPKANAIIPSPTGAQGAVARPRGRHALKGSRRLGLRGVRLAAFLPQRGRHGHRRRRHGDGGVDVPLRPRQVRHARPPPRHLPRQQDHAGPRLSEPEDSRHLQRGGRRGARRLPRGGHRRAPARHPSTSRPSVTWS